MSWILNNKTHAAIAAVILANIIWGATPPIFKWSLEDISIFTLAFGRFFLASLIFLPFVIKRDLRIEKKYWPKVFSLAFFGIFLHITFFFLGLDITTSINAPIVASAGPIFLIILSGIFLKERTSAKKIAGVSIALLGVLLIVLLPVIGESYDQSLVGNLFFVISMFGAVFQTLILKTLEKVFEPLVLVFWSFVIAAALFFPLFLYDIFTVQPLTEIGSQGIAGIIFGGIAASAIAYSCYYFATKYLQASDLGLFTYIDPIITIMIAIPLLGEIPTPTYLIGAILVFLGIYIAEARIHYHHFHLFRTRY